jgi:DNA-binding CsgD family transcriptional regulator
VAHDFVGFDAEPASLSRPELLSELIGDIYQAALDPACWSIALERACDFVGGTASMIMWKDLTLPAGGRYHSWGDDPVFTERYFSEYIKLDPINLIHQRLPVAEIVSYSSLMDRQTLLESRFYKEWMLPQGFVDNAFVNLDRSAWSLASFAVVRHQDQGLLNPESMERFALLMPHVRRAVVIGKLLDVRSSELGVVSQTLDNISAAVFIVDVRGRVIQRNRAGGAMLDGNNVVHLADGQLTTIERKSASDFSELLVALRLDAGEIGDRGTSCTLLGRDGRAYVASVLPIDPDVGRQRFDAPSVRGAIFIRHAAVDTQLGTSLLARHYRLTPRETEVLHALMEAGGIQLMAKALGITERTIKAHLHSVFHKTGTDRQADLVKLAAAFSSRP